MSKLVADNLRAMTLGVETPMQYPVRGSAKAWANLNGTGTIALRDSLNIASVVDDGVANYSFNLTAALASANDGAVVGSCGNSTSDPSDTHAATVIATASQYKVELYDTATANNDRAHVYSNCVGDLA